ncbi:hypothetical protein KR054_011616 [Drosophila jambulina]|nr:hypothetical protein KR054_011616 [Drosophila jambulina]
MSAVASSDPGISGKALGRSQTTCRYYVRGICRFGELCRFSHDPSHGRPEVEAVPAESPRPRIRNWANAPVFVPRQKGIPPAKEQSKVPEAKTETDVDLEFLPLVSWSEFVGKQDFSLLKPASLDKVCPYETIPCIWGDRCPYRVHLELCEMCRQYCLHPTDPAQRRKHLRQCLEEHEQAMELSFAIARSKDKTCGICFDTIMEKAGRERRFGILPNCSHVFCLECIRTWRRAKQFEPKVTRACPECRIRSDFVYPSVFWVESKEDKEKLLTDYRIALGAKDCKYFRNGNGKCPFGNKCFYKHAMPNGDLIDVGLPRRMRSLQSQSEIMDIIGTIDLWGYHWLEMFSSDFSESTEEEEEEDLS